MTLPRAHGGAVVRARMRVAPEDFVVEELSSHRPAGEGDHLWLKIEKRGANTEWLARQLARIAAIPPRDVGYAGLKDRHAVTVQWFSLHLPGRDLPGLDGELPEGVRLIEALRHTRKLRRGALDGNRFTIVLRDCEGEREAVAERLALIAERGVPNLFGAQRFGREGGNVERARALFAGRERIRDRHLRGLLLSAARSEIFNNLLARRITDGSWDRPLPGEALILDGSRSFFVADAIDGEIERRIAAFDIHPSGPLWGRGDPPSHGAAAALELEVAAAAGELVAGLAAAGLEQERRPLRLRPAGLSWGWEGEELRLAFTLPAGAYATAVVAELGEIVDATAPVSGSVGPVAGGRPIS